jgi:hypothetical protein
VQADIATAQCDHGIASDGSSFEDIAALLRSHFAVLQSSASAPSAISSSSSSSVSTSSSSSSSSAPSASPVRWLLQNMHAQHATNVSADEFERHLKRTLVLTHREPDKWDVVQVRQWTQKERESIISVRNPETRDICSCLDSCMNIQDNPCSHPDRSHVCVCL